MYAKRLTLITTTCVTHKILFRNSRHCEGGKIMIQKIKNPRKKVARRPHLGNCAFHEEKPSFHTWAYVHVLHQPSCRDLRYITTITTHAPPPSEEITGQPPIQSSGEPQADHRKGMCIKYYRYTGCLYVAECLWYYYWNGSWTRIYSTFSKRSEILGNHTSTILWPTFRKGILSKKKQNLSYSRF